MKIIFRFILILILTGAAFLAGTAWKINHTEVPKVEEKPMPPVTTFTEEVTAPQRNNLPTRGLADVEKETIALFEKATPSVVFITTTDVREDYFTRSLKEYQSGSGSGFIWDDKGHIITNYHVIAKADRAMVTLADQTSYPAKLVGSAPSKDLVVLKIDAPEDKLKPLLLGNSANLRVGQSVFAIGNPFGLDQTLTTGIVSALGRQINSIANIPIKDVIQTDAAINPGNSGGPLLNSSGQLIGVNTAIYSPSGASAGIGFSIPVDVVKWVVPDLIKYGKMQRPTLGITSASPRLTQQLGVEGVLVIDVGENTAAAKAGIQPTYRDSNGRLHIGDVIIAIDDHIIESENDLILTLENYRIGDKVRVTVGRMTNQKGEFERVELDLVLGSAS